MPKLASVNLDNLYQNKTGAAHALMNLAQFADGPLRLKEKVENGVVIRSLGVRSWSTYFFEKLCALPGEKTQAKLQTRKAIDEHVRSFLNNSGIRLGCDTESLVATLQSKVSRKLMLPKPVSEDDGVQTGNAGGRSGNAKIDVIATKGILLRGTGTVPTGLSVAQVPALRMIADVRLVTASTFGKHPRTDASRGATYPLSPVPGKGKALSVDQWKDFYLKNLSDFARVIQTSVVMELELDPGGGYSADNLAGANAAAKEFAGLQMRSGKRVSVMVAVPTLPALNERNSAPAHGRAYSGSNGVLASAASSDSDEDSSSS